MYNYRGQVMAVVPGEPAPPADETNSIWVAVASIRPLAPDEIEQAIAARTRVIAAQHSFWEDFTVDRWTAHELKLLQTLVEFPSCLRIVKTEHVA